MVQEEFEIIGLLAFSNEKEQTIHQISKYIGKSYASTNKYSHLLIQKGVIKKRVIGPSILCSLNFENDETLASLVYLSMMRKSEYKTHERQDYAIDKYSRKGIIIHYGEKLILISDEKIKDTRLKIVSKEEFLENIKSFDFSNLIILANHEQFWKLISKVMP